MQAIYENGVVTLTGSVDNLGTKLDAERAARKAEDVVAAGGLAAALSTSKGMKM